MQDMEGEGECFRKEIPREMISDKNETGTRIGLLQKMSNEAAKKAQTLLQRRGFELQASKGLNQIQDKRSTKLQRFSAIRPPGRSKSGLAKMEVPDITVIYAHDGHEWEKHIEKCFHQLISHTNSEQPLHIHSEMIEQLPFPLSTKKIECVRKSRAQLIIMTPEFLDFIRDHCDKLIGQIFDPMRVIVILCGIEVKDIEDVHRAELVSFESWQKMTVIDQDKEFVPQLFYKTIEIMELTEENGTTQNPKFKLTPRKVREGCSKVYALLKSPIANDEEVKVYIRCNNSSTRKDIPFTKKNPYTLQFIIPDDLLVTSQIISIQVTCDGISLGIRQLKCETQMGELIHLLHSVNDPMAFLCQTLGYSAHMMKEVDVLLANSLKRNLPGDLQHLQLGKDTPAKKSEEEMPTILHFAAHFGLKELCALLLDCPTAKIACNMRNAEGYYPAELAEISGHQDLAQMLENFANLAVTADLYYLASNVSEETDAHKIYESFYDYPSSIPLYDSPLPNPIPVINFSSIEEEDDYLPMSRSITAIGDRDRDRRDLLDVESSDVVRHTSEKENIYCNNSDTKDADSDEGKHVKCHNTKSQTELLDLLEDFKKNKFSLNEVEHLFEDWKLRQSSRSFKEKEAQLAHLRTKYDEIQHVASERGKKALTLDKIISLFSHKMGKKTKTDSPKITISNPTLQKMNISGEHEQANNRPASTLSIASVVSSISSSSSSDRGSTISNYDSGTQSDSGDDPFRSLKINIDSNGKKDIQQQQQQPPKTLPSLDLCPNVPSRFTPTYDVPPRNPRIHIERCPKIPITPVNSNLSRTCNIEERKPLPPPRPERVILPKSRSDDDILFKTTSPDYVAPDPDVRIYQIPPQSVSLEFSPKTRESISKRPLMPPPKLMPKDGVPLQKNLSNRIPNYMNLTKSDVHAISQQFSQTNHHDYYNWNSSSEVNQRNDSFTDRHEEMQHKFHDPYQRKMNLKIKNSYENVDVVNKHIDSPSNKSPNAVSRLLMRDRPLPDVPQ